MNDVLAKNFSAADAKARFDELLDLAAARPVAITNDDRLTFYMISETAYDGMMAKLEALEDQLWLMKAEANRKEGFASEADTNALLRRLEDIDDEEADNR